MSPAAYRVYVTALIAVMTVLPFTWGAIDSVADPTVVRAIVDAGPSRSIAIGVGGLLGAAALLGALRGPVVGKPFEMSVRGASPKPRATSLRDRKSTRLNSSHVAISYAVFCLKKKK